MPSARRALRRACALSLALGGGAAWAQDLPAPAPYVDAGTAGLPITRIEIVSSDPSWALPAFVIGLAPDDAFDAALARRAARELVETGAVADVVIDAEREAGGVRVRFVVEPRRVLAEVNVRGDLAVTEEVLRDLSLERGRAVTPGKLAQARTALLSRARARGFPRATVTMESRATDDRRKIVLIVDARAGAPQALSGVRLEVAAHKLAPELRVLLETIGVSRGDRADDEALAARMTALTEKVRRGGFFRATAAHRLYEVGGRTYALVTVTPGPRVRVKYEGNYSVDAVDLDDAVDLEKESERSPARVASKVAAEYRKLGFLDVEVSAELRGAPRDEINDLVVTVREHARVRVVARRYPCLSGPRRARELGSEIDSFLEEELPGATLLGPVEDAVVDGAFGPKGNAGTRTPPLALAPASVFSRETYDRALQHLQDLYRADGYLTATVGPLSVVRRTCDPRSKPGTCAPLPLVEPEPRCAVDQEGVPAREPPLPRELECRPDPRKGVSCEPRVTLRIPVQAGPRATLYDVVFDGAVAVPEPRLLEESELSMGSPASNTKIEEGRRKVLDLYRDLGFAFAEVAAHVELSPDKQRARVRFAVVERRRVTIDGVVIRGNELTKERVVRERLRFKEGDVYSQRDVRRSEELLATLGTFSSVTIGFEDPGLVASRKTVVVTVVERDPQYLELRPGVATGEGIRGLFEYGHRNIAGQAIAFTTRVQLNYLPSFLIPDDRVRGNFERLPLSQRLERRNSVGFVIPNVFHPTVRLGLDVIDVRSNSRDFGMTKEAVLPALSWSPMRQLTGTLGGSVELNNVGIFSGDTIEAYLRQSGISNDLSRLLRVPDGATAAVSQRVTAVWDRRDNPLGATRGTLVAGSVEHVHAYPLEDNPNTTASDFLRVSGRAGAYARLSKRGVAVAFLAAAGYNQQLIAGSKTYPDRLFFLGGVDTVRGFMRDSLVPQDVADRLQSDATKPSSDPTKLSIGQVAIRGGDVYLNPRTELRIPVRGALETALFVDGGNLWVDPTRIEPYRLRYAGGTGVRFATPIGPIAFDYGVNLTRRAWEDFGAFHFSVGLF
ncbi:MAG: BamA/TamA family outer membrane protein [Polyangiaceae bacterium]|nr:BamA/TamA family outer membrane protein [Polyangiaceae bacterium]